MGMAGLVPRPPPSWSVEGGLGMRLEDGMHNTLSNNHENYLYTCMLVSLSVATILLKTCGHVS